MAYTRSWTDTTPADSDQASTLGQALRNLRTDIEERMNTLTNDTWDSDPAGGPIEIVRYIHPFAFVNPQNINLFPQEGLGSGDHYVAVPLGGTTYAIKGWFEVPVGCTITKIRAAAKILTGTGGTSQMDFTDVSWSNPLAGTFGALGSASGPAADSAWHWLDASIAPHVVIAGDMFGFQMTSKESSSVGNARFGGLEVTYTRPALWNSL